MNFLFWFRTLLFSFLVPLLFLIGVIVFDLQETIRTITPPLCTIGLLVMALYLRPGWMIWWACFYSAVVVLCLMNHRINSLLSNGYIPPEYTSHLFRSAGFVATAAFCCVFSLLLNSFRSKEKQMDQLILKLPIPVVVSDQDGKISMLNDSARELLEITSADINIGEKSSASYFDLLAPKKGQGKCISNYLNAFAHGTEKTDRLELEIKGNSILGKIEFLKGPPKQLITILQERV